MYTIDNELYHHGILGMKWGVRRFQSYAENPKLSDRKKKKIQTKIKSLKDKERIKLQSIEAKRLRKMESAKKDNEADFNKENLAVERKKLQDTISGNKFGSVLNAVFNAGSDAQLYKETQLRLDLESAKAQIRIKEIDDIFKDYGNMKMRDLNERYNRINEKADKAKEKVKSKTEYKTGMLSSKLY